MLNSPATTEALEAFAVYCGPLSDMISSLLSELISTLNDVVCFQLLPINAAYTMGINHGEETASRMEYDGSGCTPADCTNSAQIAMDNGYTISVKTEYGTPDRSKEETSRVADETVLELSGSPAGRVFTIFDHMIRNSSGARLCVIAVPNRQKATIFCHVCPNG